MGVGLGATALLDDAKHHFKLRRADGFRPDQATIPRAGVVGGMIARDLIGADTITVAYLGFAHGNAFLWIACTNNA